MVLISLEQAATEEQGLKMNLVWHSVFQSSLLEFPVNFPKYGDLWLQKMNIAAAKMLDGVNGWQHSGPLHLTYTVIQ